MRGDRPVGRAGPVGGLRRAHRTGSPLRHPRLPGARWRPVCRRTRSQPGDDATDAPLAGPAALPDAGRPGPGSAVASSATTGWCPSAALPLGRTLLDERGQALLEVLRAHHGPDARRSVIRFSVSSSSSSAASTTARLSHTASGAASQIVAARASASVLGRARLDQAVHQPELVGPLGRDGLAGEDGLHRRGRGRWPGGGGRARPLRRTRLRLTSASPNAERVVATTRSEASTISHPPAVASPSTATITGLRRSR